jgi:hypothetical protein
MSLNVHFSRRTSANAGRLLPDIDVAIQLEDIVEIARPRPSGQGAKFLREGFDIVVGHHLCRRPACWCTDALKVNAVSRCT